MGIANEQIRVNERGKPEIERWQREGESNGMDDRILEHLRDTDDELTAWELSVDIDAPRGLVRARCHTLAHAGFVRRRPRDGLAAR